MELNACVDYLRFLTEITAIIVKYFILCTCKKLVVYVT